MRIHKNGECVELLRTSNTQKHTPLRHLQLKISSPRHLQSELNPKQPFNRPPVQSSPLDGGVIVCHLRWGNCKIDGKISGGWTFHSHQIATSWKVADLFGFIFPGSKMGKRLKEYIFRNQSVVPGVLMPIFSLSPCFWLASWHLLISDLSSEAAAYRAITDGWELGAGSVGNGHVLELRGVPHTAHQGKKWEAIPCPADIVSHVSLVL